MYISGKDPIHKKGHQILFEVVAETGIQNLKMPVEI